MKLLHIILITLTSMCIIGCDGIRVVQVTNLSNYNVYLETDYPHQITYYPDSVNKNKCNEVWDYEWGKYIIQRNDNLSIDSIPGGLRILLKPNQSFALRGGIGPPFGKIQPQELNFSKLKIITPKDTIIANNKQDILDLTEQPETKYNKKTDKQLIKNNSNTWQNIIIRK